MADNININNVEKFVTEMPLIEISDISKVIHEMMNIKRDATHIQQINNKPYDIIDKINLNNLSVNFSSKIQKYHIMDYDIIDDAIECIENYDASVRQDIYTYYWQIYVTVLTQLNISITDEQEIKNNSDLIYENLIKEIKKELFEGKKTDIPSNKIITYIESISSYVFYKCKFLIPIEGDTY